MSASRIAIVVDRYWPSRGGVEQVAFALSSALPAAWTVTVITHRPSAVSGLYRMYTSTAPIPQKDPAGRTMEPLDAGRWGKFLLLPLTIWGLPFLRKKLSRLLYDALYLWYKIVFFRKLEHLLTDVNSVHCISTGYLGRCVSDVCLKNGYRFIHEPFIHFDHWGDSPAQLRAYTEADVVICPTERFARSFVEKTAAECPVTVKVIPPVIIIPQFPLPPAPPVPGHFVLFLGRREAHKGLTELLVAFNGLEHIGSLVVAGPGDKIQVRNMAVFDLGEVDEKEKVWLLTFCDILCVPSTDESFGIVFAEAMHFGKPVVAFDVAPVNEIVINGETGILVPPDDTDSLHEALELLLTDSQLRHTMGEMARRRFNERYSSATVIRKIIDLHTSLAEKPSIHDA